MSPWTAAVIYPLPVITYVVLRWLGIPGYSTYLAKWKARPFNYTQL